jgi:putative NADH-flavin reductase
VKLEKREGLTAKAGDVYDTASLATLIRGNEAIISAFNPGWKHSLRRQDLALVRVTTPYPGLSV